MSEPLQHLNDFRGVGVSGGRRKQHLGPETAMLRKKKKEKDAALELWAPDASWRSDWLGQQPKRIMWRSTVLDSRSGGAKSAPFSISGSKESHQLGTGTGTTRPTRPGSLRRRTHSFEATHEA